MIEVDFDRCEANGVCVGHAPDVFDLNDKDEPIVSSAAAELPENRDGIEAAIAGCPRAALKWVN